MLFSPTGLIYPLAITSVVQTLMPEKAEGSLLRVDGRIVGSELIGQMFTGPGYFHGRPSYVDYCANGSGGSNLGPSSSRLVDVVRQSIDQVRRENDLPPNSSMPTCNFFSPQAAALIPTYPWIQQGYRCEGWLRREFSKCPKLINWSTRILSHLGTEFLARIESMSASSTLNLIN